MTQFSDQANAAQADSSAWQKNNAILNMLFGESRQFFGLGEIEQIFGCSRKTARRWFEPYLRAVPGGPKVPREIVLSKM